MKDVYVLGIHGFSAHSKRTMHNSGVALLKNGEVIFATDEERFSRMKNDGAFPFQSLEALYRETKVKPSDISYVAMPDRKSLWQLRKIFKYVIKTYFETGVFASNYLRESLKRTVQLKRTLPDNLSHCKIFFVEHHLAHAASSYYSAPWREATIISIDGSGDFSMSGLFAKSDENKITILKRLNGFYSPGIYYMIVTEVLGFISGRHEGKVTGLSAYGKPVKELENHFREFLQYKEHKFDFFSKNVAFEIDDYISKHWVNGYNPELGSGSKAELEYQKYATQRLSTFRLPLANYSREDIAYAAQNRLEEVVLAHVKNVISKTEIKNICLAGGVFANVRLNQKIRELEEVDNLFVYPAMNDSGLSVGAALHVYYDHLNHKFTGKQPSSMFLGINLPENQEIEHLLKSKEVKYLKVDNIESKIAEALSSNKIVAHFNGRAEYGPRSLGNRSIFASATNSDINESLNRKLNRTEFMPFAPILMIDYAKDLLIDWSKHDHNSKFMTITYKVSEKMKSIAPAVVHVDGTARPQVVSPNDNLRVYNILSEYQKITGIPVLVNTSFNLHEEPITNSPEDALRVLNHKAVDILVINNLYIENK